MNALGKYIAFIVFLAAGGYMATWPKESVRDWTLKPIHLAWIASINS